MTLKYRVIPVLLLSRHGIIKGKNFDHSRHVGSPLPLVRVYRARDVDELILVDVDATRFGTSPAFRDLEILARECNFPVALGGGVTNKAEIERLFSIGADKVILNSVCYEKSGLLSDAAREFGAQSLVVSIDYRVEDGMAICYSRSGTKRESFGLKEWAIRMAESGAGELVICNCDRDGMMNGYDLENLQTVVDAVRVPVVASGGAGNISHFAPAILESGASAVAAGSIFLFTETTPSTVRNELCEAGIPVRALIR